MLMLMLENANVLPKVRLAISQEDESLMAGSGPSLGLRPDLMK